MKLEIKQSTIAEVLKKASKSMASNTSIAILQGVLVTALEKEIIFTGSDNSTTITVRLPLDDDAKVLQTGSVVFPKRMIEVIQKLKGTITLETDDRNITVVKTGKAEFEVSCWDAEEFPKLPKVDFEAMFMMDGQSFSKMVRKSVYAASKNDTRPILQAINVQGKENCITYASTDSLRLGLVSKEVSVSETFSVPVPAKAMNDMEKLFVNSSEDIEFFVNDNQFVARSGDIICYTRLMEGNYPPVQNFIPGDNDINCTIQVNRLELLEDLEKMKIIAETKTDSKASALATLRIEGMMIVFEGKASGSKGSIDHPYLSLDGDTDLQIKFSLNYVIDCLKALDCEQVVMKLIGAMKPFVIEPLKQEGLRTLAVISPVR